jgi:hypothetical protein
VRISSMCAPRILDKTRKKRVHLKSITCKNSVRCNQRLY